jgi:hypothetical protein
MPNQNQINNSYPSIERSRQNSPGAARPTVRLLLILDRSVSMAGYEEHVTAGLRSFVHTLSHAATQPHYVATLVEFADEPETIMVGEPLEKLAITYKANGEGTALWDAMAHAFVLEKSRHEPTVCLIVTDGQDNCSREGDRKQVTAMIQARREWGNWTIVWLDLEGKPNKNARALGIDCLASTRSEVGQKIPEVAERIARVAARISGGDGRFLTARPRS